MLVILFYHVSSFFRNYWLYFLITAVIAQIFISTTELAIPTGIPIKKAKKEMETHPVTVEAEISKCLL